MIGYFISNPQSVYYESPIFTGVLNYIQRGPKDCKMSEANDKLAMLEYRKFLNELFPSKHMKDRAFL